MAKGKARKPKGETQERKVWTRERLKDEDTGMPRVWEPFIKETEACFWGLTFDEGQIARRMASNEFIGAITNEGVKKRFELDEEKLSLAYIVLSARGGDTEEYAFDMVTKKAPTLLQWPDDVDYIKRNIPSGRIHVLGNMIDRISVMSFSRLQEHFAFFSTVLQLNFTFASSLSPSIEEVLKGFSDDRPSGEETIRKMREILETTRLMGSDLKSLSDWAGTLQGG